jgi:hypothetical protein
VGLKSHVRGNELARGGFLEELRKQSHVRCYWCCTSCEGFFCCSQFSVLLFFFTEKVRKNDRKK